MKRNISPLAREHWDFSGCPEERLRFCWSYEYARMVPEIVDEFRRARKNQYSRTSYMIGKNWHHVINLDKGDYGNTYSRSHPHRAIYPWNIHWKGNPNEHRQNAKVIVFDLPPGFPHKPYLSVMQNHKITERSFEPEDAPRKTLRSKPDPEQDYSTVIDLPDDGGGAWAKDLGSKLRPLRILIDWRAPPKTLANDFYHLIKRIQPMPPLENRGQNLQSKYISYLKKLGAYRLIEHFGSAAEAHRFTCEQGINQNQGLYSQPGEWSAAKRHVEKIKEAWTKADSFYVLSDELADRAWRRAS